MSHYQEPTNTAVVILVGVAAVVGVSVYALLYTLLKGHIDAAISYVISAGAGVYGAGISVWGIRALAARGRR